MNADIDAQGTELVSRITRPRVPTSANGGCQEAEIWADAEPGPRSSFQRKPESSVFRRGCVPAFAGNDQRLSAFICVRILLRVLRGLWSSI